MHSAEDATRLLEGYTGLHACIEWHANKQVSCAFWLMYIRGNMEPFKMDDFKKALGMSDSVKLTVGSIV